jgi:hypothetical protein
VITDAVKKSFSSTKTVVGASALGFVANKYIEKTLRKELGQ